MGFIYCDVHQTMGFFYRIYIYTQPAILMDPKGFFSIQWLGGSVSELGLLGLLIFPKKGGGELALELAPGSFHSLQQAGAVSITSKGAAYLE